MGFLSEPLLTNDFEDQFLHNLISGHVNGFTLACHREDNNAVALKITGAFTSGRAS